MSAEHKPSPAEKRQAANEDALRFMHRVRAAARLRAAAAGARTQRNAARGRRY
jgi:hypothetical protein